MVLADLPNPIGHQQLLLAAFGCDRPYPSAKMYWSTDRPSSSDLKLTSAM
ncbi:MAG: hypothetical protein LH631_02855 [Alkalinema sp. CAN_BIN05]|nr:hypothetical protein [Alkalinema sp. CAN_BIN05]